MHRDKKITVIIPAFNVEKFLSKSVESALIQKEVGEIIIVEDGSTDNTLKIAESFSFRNNRIKVLTHPNNVNRGRGATRNLGIQNANYDLIAFLDADDYFLKGRFTNDLNILTDKSVDGVYNAVGFNFYREIKPGEEIHFKPNTLSKKLAPENLFEGIVSSKYGYLHLNGLTVRRESLIRLGLFNESLKVTQDSDLIFKLSLKYRLCPSIIDIPSSMRGIHDDNVFNKSEVYIEYNPKLFESLVVWSLENEIPMDRIDLLLQWLWHHKFKQRLNLLQESIYWLKLIINNPILLTSSLSIKYFPIVRKRKQIFSFLYQ
ncbi:Glycosyltransferase involved in cell wall bisynthesis [Nonlabens sp. Hel1_33_55]|uniref:glycosyltransferase family 2 protein n=1 Tax=Nonlabens sp. Hel1_33_55 TaxID=1336802 RepID=UPI000875DBDA|nr:glycosyltransferase family 2 protein [Nonlabens sp. Hel1_33_55]SCX92255.1 Glycosyltransferase involved in cell wall bisynthesis [Nonlabens sp. Hel1_33_55]